MSSPELSLEIQEQALALEEKKIRIEQSREEWKLCCSNSSSALIKYVSQMSVCGSVLIFSGGMIIRFPEQDNSIYFSLIGSVVGYILPSPSLSSGNAEHK